MTAPSVALGMPAAVARLAGDEVHVWVVSLTRVTPPYEPMVHWLSADELERAERFRFERDRRRFVATRGLLRQLLADYLGMEPAAVMLEQTEHGKPALARPLDRAIAFNVSHSENLALLAFSLRGELGIDVEAIRPVPDRDQIAAQFFSPVEVAQLAALPGPARDVAFFTCWTRKEAYVKAQGEGLALSLSAFEVSVAPDLPPSLIVPGDENETGRWALYALSLPPGYAGALVTEGPRVISLRAWTGQELTCSETADAI